MNPYIRKEKEKARNLFFADFDLAPEKAKLYIEDMETNPEKATKYSQLIISKMSKNYESFKQKTLDEINQIAKQRVEQWTHTVGPVTVEEFVMMSKQWDIPVDSIIDRKMSPALIREMLDCFLIGQDKYKMMLSVSFFSYIMTCKNPNLCLPKSNLLVCGPSGSGKTYGMQVLCKLFRVPFVIVHCNSLVQGGIVGTDIPDYFTSLYLQGWSREEIAQAVLCFDEFDKLFSKNGCFNGRIVDETLSIIDEKGEIEFRVSNDPHALKIKVSTRKMMFVFTGVFDGLKNRIKEEDRKDKKAVKRRIIGFGRQEKPDEEESVDEEQQLLIEKEPEMEDFVSFGVKPEILGRVQNFVFLEALNEDHMVRLLSLGQHSPFSDYELYFSQNGVKVVLTDDGKKAFARLACGRKLGVRGLKSIIQQVMFNDMYELNAGDNKTLYVNEEYIMNNLKL